MQYTRTRVIFLASIIFTVFILTSYVPFVDASHYCNDQRIAAGGIFYANKLEFNKNSYSASDSPSLFGKVSDCNVDDVKVVIKDSCGKIVATKTSSVPRSQGDYPDSFWVQVPAKDWYFSGKYSATASSNGKQISSTSMSFNGNGPKISSTSDPKCSQPSQSTSSSTVTERDYKVKIKGTGKNGGAYFDVSGVMTFTNKGGVISGDGTATVNIEFRPAPECPNGRGSGTFSSSFSVSALENNSYASLFLSQATPISKSVTLYCDTKFGVWKSDTSQPNPLNFAKSSGGPKIKLNHGEIATKRTNFGNNGYMDWTFTVIGAPLKTLPKTGGVTVKDYDLDKLISPKESKPAKPAISVSDIKLSLLKRDFSLKQGQSSSFFVFVYSTGEKPETVNLSATQWLMNDIKVSFSPNSVTASKDRTPMTSTTIQTSCDTAPGQYLITVSGSLANSFKQTQQALTLDVVENPSCDSNSLDLSHNPTSEEKVENKDPLILKDLQEVQLSGSLYNKDTTFGELEFVDGAKITTGTKLIKIENKEQIIEIAPKTRIEKNEKGTLDLIWGKIKVTSQLLGKCTKKGSQFKGFNSEGDSICTIRTNLGNIVLRGTEFIVEHDKGGDQTKIHLYEGSLEITQTNKDATPITLERGHSAIIDKSNPPTITQLNDSDWNMLEDELIVKREGSLDFDFYSDYNPREGQTVFDDYIRIVIKGNVGEEPTSNETVQIVMEKDELFSGKCEESIKPNYDGSFRKLCFGPFGAGDYKTTVKWKDQQITKNFKRIDDDYHLQKMLEAYQNQNYEETLKQANILLEMDPSYQSPLSHKAMSLLYLKQFDSSLKVIELYESSFDEYCELALAKGISLHTLERLESATKQYDRALELCSSDNALKSKINEFKNKAKNELEESKNTVAEIKNQKTRQKVPDWVKNNAKWWSQGQIGDSDFVSGLEHLIKENIISVPYQDTVSTTSKEIPNWVKTQVGWWANGQISEEEFLNSVQYLIEEGIVRISSGQQKPVTEKTGLPDSDSDGIIDAHDSCPHEYGTEKNGCSIEKNLENLIIQAENSFDIGDYAQTSKIAQEILTIDRKNYVGIWYLATSLGALGDYWGANEVFQYVGLDYFPDNCDFLVGTAASLYYLDDAQAVEFADRALELCPENFDPTVMNIIKEYFQ